MNETTLQHIKDWSVRTRSDLAPIQEQLEHPDQLFAAKALIIEVLRNFDELDKLLADTKGSDLVSTNEEPRDA